MPVGACMVAEAAVLAGHRVRVLDLMFEQNPLNTLESELNTSNPDFIGLSVRNIDNNYMQHPVEFFKDLKPLMDTIRSKSPAPVVLGGAAVSVMPEELLRYTGANWAVLGDGEVVFSKLLSALSLGAIPGKLPGIAWLEDNSVKKNTGYVDRFPNGCLTPNFHRWIDVAAYLSRLYRTNSN